MTLHNPALERRLKRKVRQAVRASKSLRRAAKAHRKTVRRTSGDGVARSLILGVACLLCLLAIRVPGSLDVQLALCAVWFTGWGLLRSHEMLHTLYASPDLLPLSHLPIDPQSHFQWQWQKIRSGTSFLLVDSVVLLGLLAWIHQLPASRWPLVLGLAWLQWRLAFGLALLVMTRLPGLAAKLNQLGCLLLLAPCGVALAWAWHPDWFQAYVPGFCALLALLQPSGWVLQPLRHLFSDGSWLHWLFLVPAGWVLWEGRAAFHTLRACYVGRPPEFGDYPLTLSGVTEPDVESFQSLEMFTGLNLGGSRPGRTEVIDAIKERRFLRAPPKESEHWVDRLESRWMNEREKLLLECLEPARHERSMLAPFVKWLIGWSIIAAVVTALWGGIAVFHALLTGGIALAFLNLTASRAFYFASSGGQGVELHCLLPVGYYELCRINFKLVAVRCAVFLAIAVAGFIALGWVFSLGGTASNWKSFTWGAGMTMSAILFSAALVPATTAMRFVRNRSGRRFLVHAFVATIAVVWVLLIMFAGMSFLMLAFERAWFGALACTGIVGGVSLVLLPLCGWIYNRNR